jgi:kynurenine formamidase
MKITDLTHVISPNMPVFPGTEPPVFAKGNTLKEHGFREAKITMYSHTGTHIDAPAHLLQDGASLDSLDINHFIGPAAILDFSNINQDSEDRRQALEADINRKKIDIESLEFFGRKLAGWILSS